VAVVTDSAAIRTVAHYMAMFLPTVETFGDLEGALAYLERPRAEIEPCLARFGAWFDATEESETAAPWPFERRADASVRRMEYRLLGRTGVKVSSVGFGTMSFGGDADEATSAALFSACRDAGVNLFDCADIYNGGEAERILGKLVASCRDEVVLTSKAYFPAGQGPNDRGSSRYHLVRSVEQSLRRLGTDRVDVFFLHRFDEATDLEESLRAVEGLVRDGKVLYPAVSNFAAWQTQKALGIARREGFAPLVCVQPQYSLAKRQAEVEILPQAKSEGLGVLPYSPLGGGLLTGKFGPNARPEAARIVQNRMYAARFADPSHFALAERFTELASSFAVHPVTLAVAWVKTHEAVTSPLLGARSVAQLAPALAAADFVMDEAMRASVSALAPEPPTATDREDERTDASANRR
jgi:aryl-alcohol dehydrogenase-like predicted oxidoreductase